MSAFISFLWGWWARFSKKTLKLNLGLENCKLKKLTLVLNIRSIQYADKIIRTKRRQQQNATGFSGVSPQNPPDPC